MLEGGNLRVTWYTSEEATESIEIAGQTFTGDVVALRKNHEIMVDPNPELVALETYTLTVTVFDSSGNTNSSSVDIVVSEENAAAPSPDSSTPPGHTAVFDSLTGVSIVLQYHWGSIRRAEIVPL